MEITKQRTADALDVHVKGRLDAYWADHLTQALDDAVREGADRIRLHMAEVSYLSSAGIRVLLKFHKQLRSVRGSFSVANPSEAVKRVLELAGLEPLLASATQAAPQFSDAAVSRRVDRDRASFETYDLAPGATLACRVVGSAALLDGCRYTAEHCRTIRVPEAAIAVGLGAFGNGFEECQGRFGEFLAAAGAAAYLPTDGTNVPDYLIASHAYVPELAVLYALVCEGPFANVIRFAARERAVGLCEVVEANLELAQAGAIGFVMIAESAGLVGAALRRSPASTPEPAAPFAHPQVRDWLSFTPERAYARSVVLAVGIAARDPSPELAPILRPVRDGNPVVAHVHAAAFSYRPLAKGAIELQPAVAALFEAETLQGILHLLADDRPISGAGESEFVRGACWVGPIGTVCAEPSLRFPTTSPP